jgi:hypothetical protein
MTQCQPDIKSFFKTDLKSEQKGRYVDRHLKSEKTTQRRANIKSFLKDRCRRRMTQRRSAQVFFVDY